MNRTSNMGAMELTVKFRFLQRCCWRFKFPCMLSRADLYTFAEFSTKPAAPILKFGLLDPADAGGSTWLES